MCKWCIYLDVIVRYISWPQALLVYTWPPLFVSPPIIAQTLHSHHRVIGILSSKGSSGRSCIFPLATNAMLAFSHPFGIWCFPSQPVRWLYKLTSQVACKDLIKESPRSTSIFSLVTPDCIWVWILMAYQLVNRLNYKQKRAVNQKKSARWN